MKIDTEIAKLIGFIKDGVTGDSVRSELLALEARKAELEVHTRLASEIPPLLHPNMADRWRDEVTQLRDALAEDRCDPEARQSVRNMVEEIRLTPRDGILSVEVKGNLAAMLSAADPAEDWQRQMALVAGARSRCDLASWWVAA